MIEFLILAVIAAVVLYYLYNTLREYMGNENNLKRFLQEEQMVMIESKEPTLKEKIRSSEFGVLSGILGYIANADGDVCPLEQDVAQSLLNEMAKEMSKMGDADTILDELKIIFFESDKDIQTLTQAFCDFTKGEYKKKLKVVEFCFVLGYADGHLNDETKEAIIDVGALLEIDNQDFNALYEDFAQSNEIELSVSEAEEIFGADAWTQKTLNERYLQLIAETKQNLVDDENLQKFRGKDQLIRLQQIHKAYQILQEQNNDQMENKPV